jgi:hypothetical protein
MKSHGGSCQFPDDAFADAISPLHLCSVNWTLRLSCASDTLFRAVMGTVNRRSQKVQTPTAGTLPSHFTTLRLRFGTASLSDSFTGGLLFGGAEL